jgi:putative transposase
VTVSGRRGRKLSIAGLAAYRAGHRPRLLYRVILHTGRKGEPKSFTEDHFAALLDAAHQQLDGPILLVWDGLPQHKSARMRALIAARRWLRVYPLPALAPELNPTETVWSSLKRSMANLAPGSIKDLARITRNRIKSMQYQPDLIAGFFASTGLRPP